MGRKNKANKLSNINKDSPSSIAGSSNRNIGNLVTSQQQTLASQASVYTQKTTRSRTTSLPDEEDFFEEDANRDELRQVFVSEEEEKVIQKILEIAHKGKINQSNAFEIPLKVVDNDDAFMMKGRFWKFASQLLGASISIYDKRIENAWTNTNKVHSKLMRINVSGKEKDQDRDQQISSRRSNEFLVISDIFIPQNVDYKNIGSQTLQEARKISLINLNKHFINDPLFFKKLQAFDKTSLKSLLLNVFDLKNNLEVKLFDDQTQKIEKSPFTHPYMQEVQENTNKKKPFSAFSNVTKLRNRLFSNSQQNKDKLEEQLTRQALQDSDFKQQFREFQEIYQNKTKFLQTPFQLPQMPIAKSQQLNISQSQDLPAHEVNFPLEYHSVDHDNETQTSQTVHSQPLFGMNSAFFTETISQDYDHQNLTSMMPWELQMKLKKLTKKKMGSKKDSKREKKKKQIQEFEIDFDSKMTEDRKMILGSKNKNSHQIKGSEKNLLPKNLGIHERYNRRKIQNLMKHSTVQVHDSQYMEDDEHPTFLQNDHQEPEKRISEIKEVPQEEQQAVNFGDNENISFFRSNALKTEEENERHRRFYQKNIRQVKQLVYKELSNERELNLSEMNNGMMLSPQSMLITFLHLANEKNLVVQNNDNESDVCLSWQ